MCDESTELYCQVGQCCPWMLLYGTGQTERGAVRTQIATVNGYVQQVQLMGLTHLTQVV